MYLKIILTIIAICLVSLNIKIWTPNNVLAGNHWATKDDVEDVRNELRLTMVTSTLVKRIVEQNCQLAIPLYGKTSRRINCGY